MGNIIGLTGLSSAVAGYLRAFLEVKEVRVVSLDTLTRQSDRPVFMPTEEPMDWVIHLGAHTSIEESWNDPFKYYKGNTEGTLTALEIAHLNKAKFIHISSYVYGEPQYVPIDEAHPVFASNPYMGSKLISEKICNEISSRLGLPLIIFRPFHIYGPKGKPGRLIPDLVAQASGGDALTVKDPNPRRDYLYVEDFCELIWQTLGGAADRSGIYNVGSGVSYSNLEVAHAIRDLIDPALNIDIEGVSRRGDVSDCSMSPDKIKRDFNWQPRYTLQEGLQKIISSDL